VAFRIPNIYELRYSVPPNLPNPTLSSEKIHSGEAVWDQELGHRLRFSTMGFLNSVSGLVTQQTVGNGSLIFRNLREVRSTGLEAEVRGLLTPGLQAAGSYSFQQTKNVLLGSFLSNSPRNLATLNLSQALWRERVFASLDAQYRSRIYAETGASISPFSVFNITVLARNLGKHLDFSVSAYNLLDKKYFDPASSGDLQQQIQQDGRNFRVKLTWHPGER
jgi:iron complex outermembrane receptor protein